MKILQNPFLGIILGNVLSFQDDFPGMGCRRELEPDPGFIHEIDLNKINLIKHFNP